MKSTVLIVDDSPSTAQIARLALTRTACQVEVTASVPQALELVSSHLSPQVVVVDAYLPGVQPGGFLFRLREAAPRAALVLLLERGVFAPPTPRLAAQLFKPLQPRRFCSVVADLIAEFEAAAEDLDE